MKMTTDEFLGTFNAAFDIGQDKKAKELAPVISGFQARNTALAKEVAEVRQINSHLSGKCNACAVKEKELAKYDEEFEQHKEECARLKEEVGRLEKELTIFQLANVKLQEEVEQLSKTIAKMNLENANLEQKVNELKGFIEKKTECVNWRELQAKIHKLTNENIQLNVENVGLKAQKSEPHPLLVKLAAWIYDIDNADRNRPDDILVVYSKTTSICRGELRALAKELETTRANAPDHLRDSVK